MSPEITEKADLKAGATAHAGAGVIMPQAPQVEKSLLAMMTIDPSNIVSQCVSKGMTGDFFYIPAHRILWEIFRERYDKGIPIDVTSVMQQLADKKQLEAVGGASGLMDVFSYATNTGLFNLHFETLKEKFIRRSIILTANQASESAYTSEAEVDALLDETEQAVLKIRQSTDKGGEWKLSADIAAAVTNMERMMSSKGEVLGLTTGYPRLDTMINGLKGGELFIIAARPSMGKTSFLLNIMEHLALNIKKPILIFSCEMPSVQLVERLLYARSGVSKQTL
ncbi:MAG: replicative DNA helicase, partial [Akkermansia sp.]|nr:replicative DNA helicase [Akkermansia sp.]